MDDNTRLFEARLRALDDGAMLDTACEVDESGAGAGETICDDLHLVAAMRGYQVPRAEAEAACERVHARLMSAITNDEAEERTPANEQQAAGAASRRLLPRRWRPWARVIAAAAAILIVGIIGGWQISSAAAAAYPDSTLYGVKRLEERVALATAWSDQRRAAVLATIADHRLSEITYEAHHHDERLVLSLAGEYGNAMRSLIGLTASMKRDHEDTSVVLEQLTQALNAEDAALKDAQAAGDTSLTQALNSTVQSQRNAINAGNLDVTPPALEQPQQARPTPGTLKPASTPHGQGTGQQSHPNNGGNNNGTGSGSKGGGANGNGGGNGNPGGPGGQHASGRSGYGTALSSKSATRTTSSAQGSRQPCASS